MDLLTTYEAVKYIDLAKSSHMRSVQAFLKAVLCVECPVVNESHLINELKTLHQGDTLSEWLVRAEAVDSIDNIKERMRSNFRSNEAIKELYKHLHDDVDKAFNYKIKERNNSLQSMLKCKDFASLLYEVIKYTAYYQNNDSKPYHPYYQPGSKDLIEAESDFNTLKKELNEIDSQEGLQIPKALSVYFKYFSVISKNIYQTIQSQEKRYKLTSINSMLLTMGNDTSLPTMGIYGEECFEMSHYMDSNDDLFILGEGGIGKTTLLIHKLKEINDATSSIYIPIFIPLNKLRKNDLSPSESYLFTELLSYFKVLIKNKDYKKGFDADYLEDKIKKLFSLKNSPQKILLLLDGFNEISNLTGSTIRDSIEDEIKDLSKYPNVRVIITSRPFYGHKKAFKDYKPIYAQGINDAILDKYISDHKFDLKGNTELYSLLHNPLFLLMYTKINERGVKNASSRGAILYEFCNGNSSIYSELGRIKDPEYIKDPLPEYTPLLFDFIMPAIAATMEMGADSFITPNKIEEIIDRTKELTMPFSTDTDEFFKDRYKTRGTINALAQKLTMDTDKMISVLVDEFSFLQQDENNNLFFVHEYIEDYFASLFRIFTYRQNIWEKDSLYDEYSHILMNGETFELTKEIADASGLYDLDRLKDMLTSCPDKKHNYFISNLLRMLASFNNGTLCGLTFNGFDFSGIPMTMYKFSDDSCASKFINCTFSENSFLSYSNSQRVLRIFTVYDNKPATCEVIFSWEMGYLTFSLFLTFFTWDAAFSFAASSLLAIPSSLLTSTSFSLSET